MPPTDKEIKCKNILNQLSVVTKGQKVTALDLVSSFDLFQVRDSTLASKISITIRAFTQIRALGGLALYLKKTQLIGLADTSELAVSQLRLINIADYCIVDKVCYLYPKKR